MKSIISIANKFLKKNKKQFIYSVIGDLITIIAILIFFTVFMSKIPENLIEVSEIIDQQIPVINEDIDSLTQNYGLIENSLAENQDKINYYVDKITWLFFLMVISVFFTWCILEGLLFYYTRRSINKKERFSRYYLNFFLFNLIWLAISTFIIIQWVRFVIFNIVTLPIINTTILMFLSIFILLILMHLTLNSYRYLGEKISLRLLMTFFRSAFKKKNILVYLLFVLSIILVLIIASVISLISLIIGVVVALILISFVLGYYRISLIYQTNV